MFKHTNMVNNYAAARPYSLEALLVDDRSPPAHQERFEDPKACFRESVDKVVDFTYMDPNLILTYMYIIENGGNRIRTRWTKDAAGLDMVSKLYLLADYLMDENTMYSLVPEMKRLTGLEHKQVWPGDPITCIWRVRNRPSPVPSVEFIWAIYEDVAPPHDDYETSARKFLREYFSAVGAALPDLEQALPEEFVVDVVNGLHETRLWLEVAYGEKWHWKICGKHLMDFKVLASGLERDETWQGPKVSEFSLRAGFKFRKMWEELAGKIETMQKAYPDLEYKEQEEGFLEYSRSSEYCH
jgi:hypothetical protein